MGKPEAKTFAVVREFGDELVIVDEHHDVAHRLDAEAAGVWRACDGARSTTAIAAATGVSESRTTEIVAELAARDLVAAGGDTRRTMLRKAVLTGAAVGGAVGIASVLLPTPQQAFASGPDSDSTTGSSTTTNVQGSADSSNPSTSPSSTGGEPTVVAQGGSPGNVPTEGSVRGAGPRVVGAGNSLTVAGGGGGGATGSAPLKELPFTGSNVARTVAVGAAMAAAGAAGHVALKRTEPDPPATP
jgi:hypothetical protein